MNHLSLFLFVYSLLFSWTAEGLLEGKALKDREAAIQRPSYRHELAICAIFQDEAAYLAEWIAFHRLLGVSHFYLYNHLSRDGYRQVLEPYCQRGEVELIDWPYRCEGASEWNKVQTRAYEDAVKRAKGHAKWLAIIDTDEFLFPVEGDSLLPWLKEYEPFGGLAIHWQLFGTSSVERIEAGELLIEKLYLRARDDNPGHLYIKSIVRPERVKKITDPHFVHYKKPFFQVDEAKVQVKGAGCAPLRRSKLLINHYWSRDGQFFRTRKIARRRGWQEQKEAIIARERQMNCVEDRLIDRFISQLRAALQ